MANCATCGAKSIPGSLFCDGCGATLSQVQVARKLRQTSFDSVKDAKEGLLSPGERIKHKNVYIIEEAIARSGFGATFRATIQGDDKHKPILIKQMIDQSSYDQFKDQLMKAFKREAKFLKSVKHPAFPRGIDYFEKNKSFFMVMDFINGRELAKALEDYRKQNGKVEDGLLVYLGTEIADALEVIHTKGYIYRDLKPQNVMLDGITSKVKMIDFGTLYHSSDRDPLIFESEGYTPPEFLTKDKKFLPSGDVYSLGALLYEAAMGITPRLGDTAPLKSSKHDPRLVQIIQKCLEVDPLKRYQRARQVRDELMKLTRKGFWPFRNSKSISPLEIAVLPRTLYPSTCTFCEFCGFADAQSQAGYCKKCRVPLRVGRVTMKVDKNEKEFFLYADETVIGSGQSSHLQVKSKDSAAIGAKHIRIFRRKNSLWAEALVKDKENIRVNKRRILGPVELIDGDSIELEEVLLKFNLKDAC